MCIVRPLLRCKDATMLRTIWVLILTGTGALAMAQPLTTTGWSLVAEHGAFSQRDTAEDAVFLGKMWLSNAYNTGGKLTQDLWNSTDGITWTKALEPTPYDGYSEMVVYQDKLWAIKSSVWNSSDGVTWTQVLDKTPFGAIGYGECVVFQNKIWQLGGASVWNTSDGVTWDCALKEPPFGNRYGAAVAVHDNKLWLCGGCVQVASDPPEKHYPKFTTYNDVWSSPDGVNWTRVAEHAPWAERMWFVAREYAGQLWVFGGFSNRESKNFAETWTTADGVNWTEVKSDAVWSPRHEPTIYAFDGSLWLVAGNMWPLMNDVWRLTAR
jgi:hypothetical protein